MFADDERDELEDPAAPESADPAAPLEPEGAAGGGDGPPDAPPEDETNDFVESAPPLAESVVPIETSPPEEEAVEDWVTVEMPRSKGDGPGEERDQLSSTPPDEITPVEELPKVPGAGVVVEPAGPPSAPEAEPAAEMLEAPEPLIDPAPAPPLAADVPPAEVSPPAEPPAVPPPPAEPVIMPGVPPVAAMPDEVFFGPVGRGLSGVGIRDRRAQQWVTAGLAAALVACCTCACIVAVIASSAVGR